MSLNIVMYLKIKKVVPRGTARGYQK